MITGIRREEKEEQKLNFLFRKKKIKSNWCLNSFALTSSQETNLPIMQPVWLDAHWPFLVLDKIIRYWDHLSSLTTRFIKFSLQNSFRPFAFHLNLFRLLDHHIVFKEQVLYNWKNPTWSLSLAWNEFIWRISKAQLSWFLDCVLTSVCVGETEILRPGLWKREAANPVLKNSDNVADGQGIMDFLTQREPDAHPVGGFKGLFFRAV